MYDKLPFSYDEKDTAYMLAVWNSWKKDKEHLPKSTLTHIQAQWIKGEISLMLWNLPQKEEVKMNDQCEFYPGEHDGCVCWAGSDVSGGFFCTEEYSKTCQWAIEQRRQDES